ncbi:MAG TPA: hypothetical protein VGG30_09395, partial [Pirellulales bacterium]
PSMLQQYTQPLARALPPGPNLEQVMNVVNSNSGQVQSLFTSQASVTIPGAPTALRTLVAYQRDRRLRLRADTALSGTEIDLGSNDELFWFWVKRNQPPALYFCRHEQFAASAARQMLPVEPTWLPRALGVVTFDPGRNYQGPAPISAGRLEIRTLPTTPDGNTLVTVVDDSRGIVLEEHVYDRQGNRLASALLSRHQRDGTTGITLPRHVDLHLPTMQLQIGIDLKDLQINRLQPSQSDLWIKPNPPGYPEVDLADPNLRLGPPPTARGAAPPQRARY